MTRHKLPIAYHQGRPRATAIGHFWRLCAFAQNVKICLIFKQKMLQNAKKNRCFWLKTCQNLQFLTFFRVFSVKMSYRGAVTYPINANSQNDGIKNLLERLAMTIDTNSAHFKEYDTKKSLPKKVLYKLTPGTVVRVKWLDIPDTLAMLLEKVEPAKGDISIRMFHFYNQEVNSHATHSQIIEDCGELNTEFLIQTLNLNG